MPFVQPREAEYPLSSQWTMHHWLVRRLGRWGAPQGRPTCRRRLRRRLPSDERRRQLDRPWVLYSAPFQGAEQVPISGAIDCAQRVSITSRSRSSADRALASGARGRRFNSCRGRHYLSAATSVYPRLQRSNWSCPASPRRTEPTQSLPCGACRVDTASTRCRRER